jgi:hypothetical protein
MQLTVTELIDSKRAQKLAMQLRAHLEIDGPYTLVRKGADPSAIPQYIQLIGSYADWLPLLAPATAFVTAFATSYGKRLGQIAADATPALFKKREVKPLSDVAIALAQAKAEVRVGLDVPDPHFGTVMTIPAGCSDEKIAYRVSAFVTHGKELSGTMHAEVKAGRAPLASAVIILNEDGSLTVRWRARKDFADHEKRIPRA